MLITQTKVINLHGQPVKVFSIDGKLWVSKPSDLKEFKSRRSHEKAICQKCVAERTMFLFPVSSFDADYWSAPEADEGQNKGKMGRSY